MARDLGDVLDYFLPSSERAVSPAEAPERNPPKRVADPIPPTERASRRAALPIIAVPIGDRDVVRAAYAWNLAVEVARMGASSTLIAPIDADSSLLWPDPGTGPVGCEMVLTAATDLASLNRCALDVAVSRAAESPQSGVVFVRVPPEWLKDAKDARGLLRRNLLFGTSESRDQLETYGLAKQLVKAHPDVRIGVTIHGVRRVADAEQAFRRVADVAEKRLGRTLASYGLLVDDLHIYRAIVARRPIGLEHPQSRATRALQDVARLLLEDTRVDAVA